MSAKPSLYEILGLSDKASPEQIQEAYETRRQALEQELDSEDKRNRLAILRDVHNLLNDRRQRAGYDRRQRDRHQLDRRHATAAASPPARSRWPAFVLVAMLGAAYPAWRHFTATAPVVAQAQAPQSVAPLAAAKAEPAIAEDIAALLPPEPPAAPPTPTPQGTKAPPQVAPQQNPARPVAEAPHAKLLAKIADSTFAIAGGAGFGTGVAIEPDKLLTNCHVVAPNVLKGPMYAISAVSGARTLITEAAFLITEDACIVHAPGLKARPAAMGNAAQLARGTPIFNIGFTEGRIIFSAGALLGVINRGGQPYLVSSNYCNHGVSGGPLVDAEGRLVGLTSGGPRDRSVCLSLTAETARQVLAQTPIAIDAFPPNYLSNLVRRW